MSDEDGTWYLAEAAPELRATHRPEISAGEIRAAGITLASDAPDCATVPRSAMRFETAAGKAPTVTGLSWLRWSGEALRPNLLPM